MLTVPASFDEVARELTLEAARVAGLARRRPARGAAGGVLRLAGRHTSATGGSIVGDLPLVLVVDVGGGTTDLSLIAARHGRGELALERVAVGEHLLLGGDNMDIALARTLEARLDAGRAARRACASTAW